MKNVLVTAATSPLGLGVIRRLRRRDGVEHIVGLEPSVSSDWIEEAELVATPSDHGEMLSLLAQYPIDTVIHCGAVPDRTGTTSRPREARVIETMRLGAAVADRESSVRSWVIASSSDVYPTSSQAPLLHEERGALDGRDGTPAAGVLEAEDYARDVADRRPHLNVAILRLQQLVGDHLRSPMAALLAQPVLPSVIGFDPPIQLLDVEDAVDALAFAAQLELAGVYNVASAGTTRLSTLADILGKRSLPVLPLEAPRPLVPLARRLGIPHVPEGLLPVLQFGHALDTHKLSSASFSPTHDQTSCALRFAS